MARHAKALAKTNIKARDICGACAGGDQMSISISEKMAYSAKQAAKASALLSYQQATHHIVSASHGCVMKAWPKGEKARNAAKVRHQRSMYGGEAD